MDRDAGGLRLVPGAPAPTLLGVVGPTGVGKTALAVGLAARLGGELLNADSPQVLRGLTVATCAPTPAELHGVRCHLLDLCEPGDGFNVVDWLVLAREAADDLARRGIPAILVGGTGLFVDALVDGFAVTGDRADPLTRALREGRAVQPGGLEALAAELRRRDAGAAGEIDLRNPRRVIRALEILDGGAGTLSSARQRAGGRPARLIGLDADRPLHERLVRARVERMFAGDALLSEVSEALARGISAQALAGAGIGYREAMGVTGGKLSRSQAAAAVVSRTLRYAKAQRTWFRRRRDLHWLRRETAGTGSSGLVDAAMEALDLAGQRPRAP